MRLGFNDALLSMSVIAQSESANAVKRRASWVAGHITQVLFDAQQLVVLGDAVRAAQ